jgi:uncharacterized membrane protein required for colicin V production
VFHEVTGVLTFVAATFAAYFGYQFVAKTRKLPPATRRLGKGGHDWFPGCAAQQ